MGMECGEPILTFRAIGEANAENPRPRSLFAEDDTVPNKTRLAWADAVW